MTKEELKIVVANIKATSEPYKITTRDLFEAHDCYRRTSGNCRYIDNYLLKNGLSVVPNYKTVGFDTLVELRPKVTLLQERQQKKKELKTHSTHDLICSILDDAKLIDNALAERADGYAFILRGKKLYDELSVVLSKIICEENDEQEKYGNYHIILRDHIFKLKQSTRQIISDFARRSLVESKKGPRNIQKKIEAVLRSLTSLSFSFSFFEKLGFLQGNVVMIGANGSGKTSLALRLKKDIASNCIVIGAQKLLIVPEFKSIASAAEAEKLLLEQQSKDKTLKSPYLYDEDENEFVDDVIDEFSDALSSLFAGHNKMVHEYYAKIQQGQVVERPFSTLERVMNVWNELFPYRHLSCRDGMNIVVQVVNGNEIYPACQLSDGEKVALYLIAEILQASSNGVVIVDEPECYLHRTIINKVWDRLEQERPDCQFIYLTHSLEFAEARKATKLWIKSCNPKSPFDWEIEAIPENDIPQRLLMELLGSRKPILFCEGVHSKKTYSDEQIYSLLFPQFTVVAVSSCTDVINYTKTYNKIPNIGVKAYGIIDADFRPVEQIEKLKQENIHTSNVAEIENLFITECLLEKIANKQDGIDAQEAINGFITCVKQKFEQDMPIQVANYVSAYADFMYKECNVKKGNDIDSVKKNIEEFCKVVNVDTIASEREKTLKAIKDDYVKIISVYNNKGLCSLTTRYFTVTNYLDRAYVEMKNDENIREKLRESLSPELNAIHKFLI